MRSRLLSEIYGVYGMTPETDTSRCGLNFIKLDGDIGCLGRFPSLTSSNGLHILQSTVLVVSDFRATCVCPGHP